MKFLTNIDLNKNELQNIVIHHLGVDPSSPKEGQIWYHTGDHKLKYAILDESSGKVTITEVGAGADSGINTEEIEKILENYVEKVKDAPEYNIPVYNDSGTLVDSSISLTKLLDLEAGMIYYMPKVTNAKQDHIAVLAADGTIRDGNLTIDDLVGLGGSGGVGSAGGTNIKGGINSIEMIPTDYIKGDLYYVLGAFEHEGKNYEVGDVFIAKRNSEGVFDLSDWLVLETNKDVFVGQSSGLVPPVESSKGYFLRDDGQWSSPSAAPSQFDNPILTPSGGKVTWSITHNLGRQGVIVNIYKVDEYLNYEQVICDVELLSDNECSVIMNSDSIISANSYHAVII